MRKSYLNIFGKHIGTYKKKKKKKNETADVSADTTIWPNCLRQLYCCTNRVIIVDNDVETNYKILQKCTYLF